MFPVVISAAVWAGTVKTVLILISRARNWNTKRNKKMNAWHNWETIICYTRIYCAQAEKKGVTG